MRFKGLLHALCTIFALIPAFETRSTDKDELVLLQILFRHGDRSPTRLYPTDAHGAHWTRGLGQLTKTGIWRAFNLGKYFKKTYIDDLGFLPPMFNTEDVAIRSSGYDRTIMTAQSVMTAMYPPTMDEAKWNPNDPNFPWQPIPIHSVPKKDDLLLKYGNHCPRYQQLKNEILGTDPALQQFAQDANNRKVLDLAKESTGLTNYPDFMLYQLFDTLFVERENNLTLPPWVDDNVMSVLENLTLLDYHLLTKTPEAARLAGGNLLAEFLRNIKNKIEAKENGERSKRAFFYSAHDSTIMALFGAMNIAYDALPHYNAFVALELYRSPNGAYKVKASYRSDTSIYPEKPKTISLPACPGLDLCPVDDVVDYYESRHLAVKDYDLECKTPDENR